MLGHYLELLLASLSVLWRENLTAPLNPNSSFFSFYCGLSLLNGFNLLIPSHSENRKQRLFIVKAAYHQEMQILDAIIFQDSFFYFFSSDAFYPYHLSRTFALGFSPYEHSVWKLLKSSQVNLFEFSRQKCENFSSVRLLYWRVMTRRDMALHHAVQCRAASSHIKTKTYKFATFAILDFVQLFPNTVLRVTFIWNKVLFDHWVPIRKEF